MAKIQIKFEKLTHFGGMFSVHGVILHLLVEFALLFGCEDIIKYELG